MRKALAEMLAESNGGPIDFMGKSVMLSYKLPVYKGQEVTIEFVAINGTCRQGIEVSVDKRKGFIEVNGQKLATPVFWTDTAPKNFTFKCFPKKNEGVMNIWNVWQNTAYKNTDSWIGNAGLYIEQGSKDELHIFCSNGEGDVNFNDLIFKVTKR